MGFSAKQVQALRRSLNRRHVRTREANGRELSYIEGWYAISEANRIFGFDGWNRETLESRCVLARENRGSFLAVYIARVRITVHADGATIIREGHGSGEGRGTSPGEVHDIALKAAETDATKRALATFGKPFGLELYRKSQIAQKRCSHSQHRRLRQSGRLSSRRYNANSAAVSLLWPSSIAAVTDIFERPSHQRGPPWRSAACARNARPLPWQDRQKRSHFGRTQTSSR